EAFPGSRLFCWYGHAEQVILAAMCEYSDQYHIWPFYGLTEILDQSGLQTEANETGELIGTSFWNYATPFVRYRTMDMAKKGTFGCPKCRRQFQLLEKIDGRLQEIVVSKTGRYISMTAINMHSDVFDHVKQFQFYQDFPGKIIFKVVMNENYVENDTHKIRHELMKKFGHDMELDIVFVEQISRTSSGKYRFLDQRLDIKYGE
ncbi:MAG: phenylacetate--CoA ligase family protein, partial [Candidatus Hodarchaeota archaeon]